MHYAAVAGADPGRGDWAIAPPPKTYESNLIHHDFVQFEKQHSRYKVIFALHCFVTTVL